MTRIRNRRKFIRQMVVIALVLAALSIPTAQRMIAGGSMEFAEITGRIVLLPYWLVDHSRCFSPDRFDPTCPQCM